MRLQHDFVRFRNQKHATINIIKFSVLGVTTTEKSIRKTAHFHHRYLRDDRFRKYHCMERHSPQDRRLPKQNWTWLSRPKLPRQCSRGISLAWNHGCRRILGVTLRHYNVVSRPLGLDRSSSQSVEWPIHLSQDTAD